MMFIFAKPSALQKAAVCQTLRIIEIAPDMIEVQNSFLFKPMKNDPRIAFKIFPFFSLIGVSRRISYMRHVLSIA